MGKLYLSWKSIKVRGRDAGFRACLAGALSLSALLCASVGYADSSGLPHEEEMDTETGKSKFVSADVPGQEHAADDVTIKNAWMQHVGRNQQHVAAYFQIENETGTSYLIDGISSPSCSAMFGYHSDLEVGTLTRQLFTHLTVPEKQMLVFPPGGYHLVCTVADGKTIEQGMQIPVQFHFLGGSSKTVSFDVRGAKPYRVSASPEGKLK